MSKGNGGNRHKNEPRPQARNGREAKAYHEDTETIQARITAARKRAREKRLGDYLAAKRVTFQGLSGLEAGLLELDARHDGTMLEQRKADLLGVGRTSLPRMRGRVPDWADRRANRSAEILIEVVPIADTKLTQEVASDDPDVSRPARDQLYKMVGRLDQGGTKINMNQFQGQQAPALSADLLTAALSTLLQSLPDSDKMLIAKQLASGLSQTSHNNDYVNHAQLQLPEAVTVIDAQVVPQPVDTRALDSPVVEQHGDRRPGPLASPQRDERGRFESPAVAVPVSLLEPKAEDRAPTRGRGNDMKAARAALAAKQAAKKASLEARTAETPEGENQPSTPPCDKATMPDES